MAEQKKTGTAAIPGEPSSEAPRRRRRHGYRGYPNRGDSGGVHWGTGFSGVGPLGSGSNSLPRAGVLTEKTESSIRRKPS